MTSDEIIRLKEAAEWLRFYVAHYSDDPEQRRMLVEHALKSFGNDRIEISNRSKFAAMHRAMQEKLH